MNTITFPLRLRMKRPTVADLQDGLKLLIERGDLVATDETTKRELSKTLKRERRTQFFGSATGQLVRHFQEEQGLNVSGAVDEPTATALNRLLEDRHLPDRDEDVVFTVTGQVAEPDGTGIGQLTVRAYDKSLGKENELGSGRTDADGRYALTYQVEKLLNPARKQADLVVRVFSRGDGLESESPLIINALPQEVVNFVLGDEAYRGPDLYQQVHERLSEFLDGVELDELEPRDMYSLANSAQMDVEQIHHYVRARQWARQWRALPAEVFFAWFRQGLPTEWGTLLSRHSDELVTSIEQAVENNFVARDVLRHLDILKSIIIERRTDYVIAPHDRPMREDSLGRVLQATALNAAQSRNLLQEWQTFEGNADAFWAAQREQLGERVSQDLELTLQLGALTRNHVPLIEVLKQREDIQRFSDVARLTHEDWLQFLADTDIELPSDLRGDDLPSRQQAYAEALTHLTELLLPTRVLAEAFRRDTRFESQQVDRFFENHRTFEFRHQSIRSYLADHPDALAEFEDPKAVQLELEALQRIFHLSPAKNRQAVAKVLWSNQLHSAWAIMVRGEEALQELFEDNPLMAKKVFTQAQAAQQMSHAVFLQTLDQKQTVATPFFAARHPLEDSPDLESLFGGQGYCECKHCLSFFSPSAYLVDLFLYLQKAKLKTQRGPAPPDDNTVLERLFKRRPDLGNLELDCDNAMTPLPYIDLVNEVLENAITPRPYTSKTITIGNQPFTLPFPTLPRDPNAPPAKSVPQTEAEADVLKAFPQHLNPLAYDTLHKGEEGQAIVYPWTLPFNVWAAEVRVYLEHLGMPRWQLMESILGQPSQDSDVVCEYLGLLPEEKTIVLDASPTVAQLDRYWGMAGAVGKLANVELLLKRSGYRYAQLQEILTLRYIQLSTRNQSLHVAFDPESSCQVADARLKNLSEAALSRIHRLGRLERRTGAALIDLDQSIMAFGGDINEAFLEDFAELQRIQKLLRRKLKHPEILSWWNLLDTHDYPNQASLYRMLFLNAAISQPVEDLFTLETIQNDPVTLDLANPDLAPDLAAHLVGALQWTMPQLLAVVNDEWDSLAFELNLANLSYLYRVSSFCRAMRIPVSDYLALTDLLGTAPLPRPNEVGTVRPRDSRAFIQLYQLIEDVDLDPEILNYVLRHHFHAEASFALGADEIQPMLFNLQVELNKLLKETDPEGLSIAEKTQSKLSLILLPEDVEIFKKILEADSEIPLSEQEQQDFLDEKLPFFPDLAEAKAQLLEEGGLPPGDERYAYVLNHLEPYLVENAVVQQLAESLGLSVELADSLLRSYLRHPAQPILPIIRVFFAPDFLDPTLWDPKKDNTFTAATFPEQVNTVIRVQKIGLLMTRLKLAPETIRFIMQQGVGAGLPDLSQLPVAPVPSVLPTAAFATWRLLMELVRLDRSYFQENISVFDLLRLSRDPNATRLAVLEQLSAATRWDMDDLLYVTGPSGLNVTYPSDYQSGDWLVKLAETMPLVTRVGASTRQMAQWTHLDVTQAHAHSVRLAVKAKYGNEQWLTVTAPLRDEIREQQRDALLGFVLHHRRKHDQTPFADVDDLYGYYLIDPQMSACTMTSRTVLASSSVQLLVQRIHMNLESDMEFSRKHAEEWQWRKYYRVWEANRKVFLWPENWIEPELRDDKSPFFQELENELLQDELNEETVERVFVNYLHKLDEVARLEICAVHYEEENHTLHIFARTTGNPSLYYYRRWEHRRNWTAWEKVELDIHNAEGVDTPQKGISLLPLLHNRSLFLFWPIFSLSKNEPDDEEKKTISNFEEDIEVYRKEKQRMIDTINNLNSEKQKNEADIDKWEKELQEKGDIYSDIDLLGLNTKIENARHRNMQIDLIIPEFEEARDVYDGGIKWAKEQIDKIVKGHTYFQIKIAYSQYRQGNWTAKRVISDRINSPEFKDVFKMGLDIHRYSLVPKHKSGEINLEIFFDGGGYYKLNSFFKFDSCRNQLIANIKPGYVEVSIIASKKMWHMKAVDTLPGEIVSFNIKSTGSGTDLLLYSANKNYKLTYSLDRGIYKFNTPTVYEDKRRTFLVIPPLPAFSFTTNQTALISQAMAGKTGVIQYQAYQKSLKPALESPSITDQIQIIGKKSISEEYFPKSGAGQVMIRPVGSRLGTALQNELQAARVSVPLLNTDFADASSGFFPAGPVYVNPLFPSGNYIFRTFYHPYVCLFLKQLNRYGIEGLLNPNPNTPDGEALSRQATLDHKQNFNFEQEYDPNWNEVNHFDYPQEIITFDHDDAYANYNWELFFHIPLLIATRLYQDQRFETAQQWFHYIFNPMETEGELPYRYWKIQPFHTYTQGQMEADWEALIQGKSLSQIEAWQDDPFNPHLLARFRRLAYMKTTVMKYLDNLIAWGDQLFRRDSIESLNEATQLYVLAGQILGKVPVATEAKKTQATTFNELAEQLNSLGNAWVEMEMQQGGQRATERSDENMSTGQPDLTSYFCFPPNEKLLAYWDTVADRLFKIRHCMNIEGLVRQLPLFQPPIDPALLVRAAASGMDLSSALNDLYAPLPHYRFSIMVQKAQEICQELKSLGGALLTALEKKDAEALSLLRSQQETELLKANRAIKANQIKEAKHYREGLDEQRKLSQIRRDNYENRDFINAGEVAAITLSISASVARAISGIVSSSAGTAKLTPDITASSHAQGLSSGASTVVKISGGEKTGAGLDSVAKGFDVAAILLREAANVSSTFAQYSRRQEDWDLQIDLAKQEIKQIDKQILASDVRVAIAKKDQENLEIQISQSQTVADFLKHKFTDQQLYGWMAGQIASVYFQTYQLAFDIAKQAEKTFRYELGLEQSSYIQFGYWDNLRKGLLSGEKLSLDLKRLEMAYFEKNRREYELTKHISLRQLNPVALLELKATGACEITLPEWLFDLDAPGHYMRRIKSVSLSIPAVTGPYSGVNCTLSLRKSTVRRSPLPKEGNYARVRDGEDDRFVDYFGTIQSIVTSHGQNDSGLFETNLRDERYLPFEGQGVIDSRWELELPHEFRQFDYNTISDVILHLRYTARQGGDSLKQKAVEHLQDLVAGATTSGEEEEAPTLGEEKEAANSRLVHLFSLRHEFPSEWQKFLASTENENFIATIKKEYFPYLVQSRDLTISEVSLFSIEEKALQSKPLSGEPDNVLNVTELSEALRENNEFELSLSVNEVLKKDKDSQVFLVIKYAIAPSNN